MTDPDEVQTIPLDDDTRELLERLPWTKGDAIADDLNAKRPLPAEAERIGIATVKD